MFVSFARNIMQIRGDYKDDELIEAAIQKLRGFYISLGQPSSIREFGIPKENLKTFAAFAASKPNGEPKTLGNFKKLNKEDILNIYNSCY